MDDWGIGAFFSHIRAAHHRSVEGGTDDELNNAAWDSLTHLFARIDRLNAEIKRLREREAQWVAGDYEGRAS